MKAFNALAVAALSLSAGCTTTTVARAGTEASNRWLAQHSSTELEIAHDGPAGQDSRIVERGRIVLTASSPTNVNFRTISGEVVPIERVRSVIASGRGHALEGGLLGGGVGVFVGLGIGLRTDNMNEACECNPPHRARLFTVIGTLAGAGIGAAIGAVVHRHDVLEIR